MEDGGDLEDVYNTDRGRDEYVVKRHKQRERERERGRETYVETCHCLTRRVRMKWAYSIEPRSLARMYQIITDGAPMLLHHRHFASLAFSLVSSNLRVHLFVSHEQTPSYLFPFMQ